MSVYSKFFNKLLGDYDCSKGNLMYKPYPSIWHVVMDKSVGAFIGTCQFYLPLYFVSVFFFVHIQFWELIKIVLNLVFACVATIAGKSQQFHSREIE